MSQFLVTNFQYSRGSSLDFNSNEYLRNNVEYIKVADEGKLITFSIFDVAQTYLIFHDIVGSLNGISKSITPVVHVFQLHQDEAGQEELDGEENQNIAACNIWELPNVEFDGLWDT